MVPALLTKLSIRPHLATVSSIVFLHASSSETSALIARASTFNFSHSSTTLLASLIVEVQVIATFHPFVDSSFAVAAPTPLLPPVIIATGFSDLGIFSS